MVRPKLRLEDFPDEDDDDLDVALEDDTGVHGVRLSTKGKMARALEKGAVYIKAPRDWKNDKALAYNLGQTRNMTVMPGTVKLFAKRIIAGQSLQPRRDFLENPSSKELSYSPELCEKITTRLQALPHFPHDWVRFGSAAMLLQKTAGSFYTVAAEARRDHPEMFGEYFSGAGLVDDYCSREAMEIIRKIYKDRRAPPGLITLNEIANRFKRKHLDIKNEIAKTIAEWEKAGRCHGINYLSNKGEPTLHYKMELLHQLMEKYLGSETEAGKKSPKKEK